MATYLISQFSREPGDSHVVWEPDEEPDRMRFSLFDSGKLRFSCGLRTHRATPGVWTGILRTDSGPDGLTEIKVIDSPSGGSIICRKGLSGKSNYELLLLYPAGTDDPYGDKRAGTSSHDGFRITAGEPKADDTNPFKTGGNVNLVWDATNRRYATFTIGGVGTREDVQIAESYSSCEETQPCNRLVRVIVDDFTYYRARWAEIVDPDDSDSPIENWEIQLMLGSISRTQGPALVGHLKKISGSIEEPGVFGAEYH